MSGNGVFRFDHRAATWAVIFEQCGVRGIGRLRQFVDGRGAAGRAIAGRAADRPARRRAGTQTVNTVPRQILIN